MATRQAEAEDERARKGEAPRTGGALTDLSADVEGSKMAEGAKFTQHLSAFTASLVCLNVGMAMGWTSPAEPIRHGAAGFHVSSEDWSWVGASLTLGAASGGVLVGLLLQPFGRVNLVRGLAPVVIAGWAMVLGANGVWMLILGRYLIGLALGASTVVVPIYIGELAESSVRGALGTYLELQLCTGVLLVYVLGLAGLSVLNSVCLLVPIVYGAAMWCFPDTPRWLLSRGRSKDARKALVFFRGSAYPVDRELAELESAVQERAREEARERESGGPLRRLVHSFSTLAARRGLLIASGLMVLQQLCGMDAVIFYAALIFEDAGSNGSGLDAELSSVVIGVTMIVANLTSLFLVDRAGRRMLLIGSSTVMAICHAPLAAYLYCKDSMGLDVSGLSWLPVLLVAIFTFAFSMGLGPVPWLFLGEVLPEKIKGPAGSIASVSSWLSMFLVTKFFVTMVDDVGSHSPFWLFSVCSLVGAVLMYIYVPETKGKTLEEIQIELAGARSRGGKSNKVGHDNQALEGLEHTMPSTITQQKVQQTEVVHL